MADVPSDQQATEPKTTATLSDIPVKKTLEDGSKLLAEANLFLVLEKGKTKQCGSLVNEHRVQLLRLSGSSGPIFKLLVHPREGDSEQQVVLDTKCRIAPALRKIRKETHFVKPDGESLMRSINNLDGEEIRLYCFEVSRLTDNPLFNLLGMKQQFVRLGFKDMQEALGWYVYIAACASIMSEEDPDFNKVVAHQQGLADHAANTHALILNFEDNLLEQISSKLAGKPKSSVHVEK